MEFVRFDTDHGSYHVHYRYDIWLYFDVYPVSDWTGPNNTSGTAYLYKNSSGICEVFSEDLCLNKLSGSYCWRGVWEGRLYFPDNEYWSDELAELSALFSMFIEPWAIDYIIKKQGLDDSCREIR